MPIQIQLDDIEVSFRLDNLKITIEQANYGIFNTSYTKHHHGRHFYEAHLVCGGKGMLVTDDTSYPLKAGVLYMTGPNVNHEQLTDSTDPMAEYCLSFKLTKCKNSAFTPFSSALYDTHFWVGEDTSSACLRLFHQLEQESSSRNIGYTYNLQSTITSLLVALVRNYTGYARDGQKTFSNPDNKRMLIIDNCFLSQYATITESELSNILNLSTRQLQRFIKQYYNKTFSQMRQNARLNKAVELLDKGYSMDAVATMVGYEDVAYFKRLLKKAKNPYL